MNPYAYQGSYPQHRLVLHIQNFMDIQAMMMVSLPVPLQCPYPMFPQWNRRTSEKRKRDRDDSDFSGILLVSLSLRRICHMNKHRNVRLWIFMDAVMFLWSHSHLTDLGSHHTTVSRISENEYKRIRPEKVEGFPDRIRLANYADASVFCTSAVPW